jgi:hypothetical protein
VNFGNALIVGRIQEPSEEQIVINLIGLLKVVNK